MTKQFTHNGKDFEIRRATINGEHCIRVYHNNKQVSPTYSVSEETESDYRQQSGSSMVDELEKTAQYDVERGVYLS